MGGVRDDGKRSRTYAHPFLRLCVSSRKQKDNVMDEKQKAVAVQLLEEARISVKALMTPSFLAQRQDEEENEPRPPQDSGVKEEEKAQNTAQDDRVIITDSNPCLNTFCFFLEKIFLHGLKGTALRNDCYVLLNITTNS